MLRNLSMGHDPRVERIGIQFFGRMSASISHDLKNVLAVINENAGLLEDLCLMAEKGKALDPARLIRLAGDVRNQIRRGDRIISTLNTFAHSVDSPIAAIDLGDLTGLLAELAARHASLKGVRLEFNRPEAAIELVTAPFGLLNLLWRCLDYALSAAGPGKTIGLAAEKIGAGARMLLCKLEGLDSQTAAFPAEPENTLSRALQAQVGVDSARGEIWVLLPAAISG